ncbi:glyoxylase-like metal-dependent hydrolase (beta-lactamase superfamily II) [Herbaspirillum sp. Sphag1AN]|uniref:MBL fold metallo-hydrolase n=1 Tax=unclassified Herbaspirillum TaxID=2624150 RepID=UPI00161C8227|nr:MULTISPECIES: MBL fold metallo-hydrolase [unclassified Herbaspirillum]MBB3213565.1 glyoxylase-like metal-dependent hydrolase (beta-lactamase superfamily II) [Herbaspirillum sp. Sphag1AN]MBB3246763.1 glyoxylase-like metal-dependent hydrolase (beta-lactamase superfamily II) [Herbaspirillum sp. Sphag64]
MTFTLKKLMRPLLVLSLAAGVLTGNTALASDNAKPALTLDIYNPGRQALFPVSSVIVAGQHDAILVDAQFGRAQAAQVVEKIRTSGKHLTTIYISHGDPDYYFGLDTITAAFPDAKVVATPQTVAHIRETATHKLAFWGPKLGTDAPQKTIVPEVLKGNTLTLEGKQLKVIGLDGPQPDRSFVWIPSIKAVVGGVVLFNDEHVWMADTQSSKSHQDWLKTLKRIDQLKPVTVVPGHFGEGAAMDRSAVTFTRNYIQTFDAETTKASDSTALIKAMQEHYPALTEISSLSLSAKVAKGEMKW